MQSCVLLLIAMLQNANTLIYVPHKKFVNKKITKMIKITA